MELTKVRTKLQFNQGRNVINIVYNGNKLMAMFAIRPIYNVTSFSILQEYWANEFLPVGEYTIIN